MFPPCRSLPRKLGGIIGIVYHQSVGGSVPIVDTKSDARASSAKRDFADEGSGSAVVGDRENNTLRAYREMRRRVLDGEMAPGTQYLEQELAAMLGMSRTPVREALIRLADERLVEVRPRHGARVMPVSIGDVSEIYELLAELEAAAARRLATHGASGDVLAVLEAAQRQMETELKAGNRIGWFEGDRRFHATIVAAGGNARLTGMVQGLIDQSHCARLQTIAQYEITDASSRDHAEIVRAIRAKDAATAHASVHRHRTRGGKALVSLLEKRGGGRS